MKPQHTFFRENAHGWTAWCAIVSGDHLWCDFTLVQAAAWDTDGSGVKWPAPDGSAGRLVDDPAKAEAFASGFIKWDGCMELHLDQHLCDGPDSLAEAYEALQWMLAKCHTVMTDAGSSPDWEPR